MEPEGFFFELKISSPSLGLGGGSSLPTLDPDLCSVDSISIGSLSSTCLRSGDDFFEVKVLSVCLGVHVGSSTTEEFSPSPSFSVHNDKEREDLLERATLGSSDFSPKNGEDILELAIIVLSDLSPKNGEDPLELAIIVSSKISPWNGEDLLDLPLLRSSDPNLILSTFKSDERCGVLGFIHR